LRNVATAILLHACSSAAIAQVGNDVIDQFFRFVDAQHQSDNVHLPGESVDHFNGILRIRQIDMQFPGIAGLDLVLLRSYSSKMWSRTDTGGADNAFVADDETAAGTAPLGFGWSLHQGRMRNPSPVQDGIGCNGETLPTYEAPDNSVQVFYRRAGDTHDFVSAARWRYNNAGTCAWAERPDPRPAPTPAEQGGCITTTEGRRITVGALQGYTIGVSQRVWPVTQIKDVFGNRIDVTYLAGKEAGRIHDVTDTIGRVITFGYEACGTATTCLHTITATGPNAELLRRMTYGFEFFSPDQVNGIDVRRFSAPGRAFLKSATPDAGQGYSYDYAINESVKHNEYALSAIRYPAGGKTEYRYDTFNFFNGNEIGTSLPMAALRSRTTTGRALSSNLTFKYSYDAPVTSDVQTTTITRPDGLTDVRTFTGFGYVFRRKATGDGANVWRVGLPQDVRLGNDASVEHFEWAPGAQLDTFTQLASPIYAGQSCAPWGKDTKVQSPLVAHADTRWQRLQHAICRRAGRHRIRPVWATASRCRGRRACRWPNRWGPEPGHDLDLRLRRCAQPSSRTCGIPQSLPSSSRIAIRVRRRIQYLR
jgi:hypothetical protein